MLDAPTDPLAGTDLAAVELPAGTVGFGHGEVAALLARHRGAAADASAQALGVDLDQVGDDVRRAGLSSLLGRGLVEQRDGCFLPRSAAALLDYAAGRAERWTTVSVSHDAGPDVVVVLHAPEVVAIAQPRALGTWFVGFSAGGSPDAAVAAVQDAVRREHPEATFEVRTSAGAGG